MGTTKAAQKANKKKRIGHMDGLRTSSPRLGQRVPNHHLKHCCTANNTTTTNSFDHYYTTYHKQKQLEKFSIMARIAIVTYKLTLLCVFVLNCSVAKFAVYFHRKEFRRKKPSCICLSPSYYTTFQLTN